MKISTRGRYALRMMLDMALSDSDKPVRVKEIAERQEISEKYMEQIMSVLNKAGFVRSVRGPQGGYFLTKKPEEYLIGEIIELTDGPLVSVACNMPGAEECKRKDQCITLPLWQKYDTMVHDFFFHITLKDLLEGNY